MQKVLAGIVIGISLGAGCSHLLAETTCFTQNHGDDSSTRCDDGYWGVEQRHDHGVDGFDSQGAKWHRQHDGGWSSVPDVDDLENDD